MNNNINLLTEINRINSLMGIEKKLISEQPGVIDDLFELGIKSGTDVADNALASAIRRNTELLNNIKQIDTTSKTLIEKMDEIIATTIRLGDNKLADDIIDAFITSDTRILDEWLGMIDDATSKVKEAVSLGKSPDKAISDVSKQYGDAFKNSESIPNEFFDRFIRDFELELKKLDMTPPVRNVRSSVDNPTGVRELPDEEIDNINNTLQNTPWGDVESISDDVAEDILKNANRGNFGRWVRGDFRKLAKILEEKSENIIKLSKYYTETTDSVVKARLENRIKKDLYELAINGKEIFGATNSKLTDVINSFQRDTRGNIVNANQKRFVDYIGDLKTQTENFKVEKILNLTPEGKETISVLKDAFTASLRGKNLFSTARNIGKSVKEIPSKILGKEMDKATKETAEKIAQNRGNTWRWISSGSPRGNPWRTKNQINYLKIIESGGLSAAKKSYVLELVFRLMQWKLSFGLLYTFRNYLSYLSIGSEKREMINKCLSSQNKEVDCAGVDTWIKSWALDFMEGSKESQMRWIKDFADQTFGNGWGDELTDIFPGKWDDVIIFLLNFFIKSADDTTIEELEDNFENNVNNAQQGAEQTQERIEQTLESEGVEVPESQTGANTTPDELSAMGINVTDNDGDGVWESEYGELFKFENDKWKASFDNGNTWLEI